MVQAHALRILVETCETSGLLVRLDAFHLDDFGAGEHVGEFDWGSTFLLILYDFLDALLDRVALGRSLVV